jgi:C4-dicarboxylate-specific signal transduction histidine kinase
MAGEKEQTLRALVQLSSVINSTLDINEVLNNSMEFVEEIMNAEASSIFELDHERNELFFRVARGGAEARTKQIRMKMGEGVVGWVARSGEPLLVPDTGDEKRFSHRVDEHTGFKTRSLVALPIRNRGKMVGVLEVLNKRGPHPFDDGDVEVLTLAANQIGIAMENAHLHERLKEKFALTSAELKETQAKLIRSERLAALGQLSQGVAHEVRNPVMSIGGFAKRLHKRFGPEDPEAKYVEIIIKETARLQSMVEDVDRYTKMPEPIPKEIRLSALLEGVLKDWEEGYAREDICVETQIVPEDPTVLVDQDQMIQALIHLLRNASEAMPKGGTLSILTRWEGSALVISVKDNGTGIAREDLPRIFDPFFTSKTQGSGLGLTTVNRIVSDHGGEVKVSSISGKGTQVDVCLRIQQG